MLHLRVWHRWEPLGGSPWVGAVCPGAQAGTGQHQDAQRRKSSGTPWGHLRDPGGRELGPPGAGWVVWLQRALLLRSATSHP